jgi:hypothetical protein
MVFFNAWTILSNQVASRFKFKILKHADHKDSGCHFQPHILAPITNEMRRNDKKPDQNDKILPVLGRRATCHFKNPPLPVFVNQCTQRSPPPPGLNTTKDQHLINESDLVSTPGTQGAEPIN